MIANNKCFFIILPPINLFPPIDSFLILSLRTQCGNLIIKEVLDESSPYKNKGCLLNLIKILFYRRDAQIFANFIGDDVADLGMPWDCRSFV